MIHNLFLIPFLMIPLLITEKFLDPTLLIKRSAVFFIFTIITIIINKNKLNSLYTSHLSWISGLFLFIFYCIIISFLNSINFNESLWSIAYFIGWFSITLAFLLYSDIILMRKIFFVTSIIGGLLSFYSIIQIHINDYINIPSISMPSATFGNRNFWSMYLCFVIPSTIYCSVTYKKKLKTLNIIMFLLAVVALLNTRARAAWLGILFCIIYITICYRYEIFRWIKRNYLSKQYILLLLLILSVIMLLSYISPKANLIQDYKETIWSTLMTVKEIGNQDFWAQRIPQYKGTLLMIKDNLFFGVGLDNWRFIYPNYSGYLLNDLDYLSIRQRPHNDILWILSEIGLVGTFILISVITIPLYFTFKKNLSLKKKKIKNDEYFVNVIIFSCFISIFIESLFDFPRQRTIPNLYFWAFLGYTATNIQGLTLISGKLINQFKRIILISFCTLSYCSYNDIKSNIFSQDLRYYKDNKMYKKAINAGNNALSYYRNVDNTGTPIYFYLGVVEYSLNNLNQSINHFKKAYDISPYHIGTLENYLIVLCKNNNYSKAELILNKSNKIYPNYHNINISMAKLYLQRGHYNQASLIIEKIKEKIDNKEKIPTKIRREVKSLFNYINNNKN